VDWPLLASLDEEQRRAVLRSTRLRRFDRGETLVHEGDLADSLHLVETGRLAVRVTTSAGERATLNLLGPGDYFGELSLLDGRSPVRSASIVALEAATTRALPSAAFRELREQSSGVQELLLVLLARRAEELSDRVVEVMFESMDRRVSRRLHDLVRVYADGPQGPVVVPLPQKLLAELVGGTRASVNASLQGLVAEGVVTLGRGRVTVTDRAALARRAD
jgi:CRP/FNR family cyclic AMP-dependent transcriptional regulator